MTGQCAYWRIYALGGGGCCAREGSVRNNVSKLYPNSLETVCKLFGNCFHTMFRVQISVVVRMPVSVEIAAAASVFYSALSIIHSRKAKKKKKMGKEISIKIFSLSLSLSLSLSTWPV